LQLQGQAHAAIQLQLAQQECLQAHTSTDEAITLCSRDSVAAQT
jgi:hypothetical protein